jgi:hypothetical protein
MYREQPRARSPGRDGADDCNRPTHVVKTSFLDPQPVNEDQQMNQSTVDEAKAELEAAQSTLQAALDAWDASVSELWRTSLALTEAQKRVIHAHELLRSAISEPDD